MRSTRLPGKVLRPILGRPLLDLLIERVRRAGGIDQVVIATTVDPSCDPIEQLARHLGVACYRGSEDDVLDRILQAGREHGADVIVELTGDNPLIDPLVVERVLGAYREGGADYVSNTLERTYPRGQSVQVFSLRALEEAARLTQDPADREHVTLYIYSHPERFRLRNVGSDLPAGARELRLTVDAPEDLELAIRIFEALYPRDPAFTLADITAFLEQNPEVRAINSHVQQKAVR